MGTIEDVVNRIRGEFLEMPGMRLKAEQVRRLCGLERGPCQRVLDVLVDAKFLYVRTDGQYARVTDGELSAHGTAAAGPGTDTVPELDWQIARDSRCHVLVAGAAQAVERSLAVLMPHLDPPVCYWIPDASLPRPADVKTLVIRHVDALSAERQRDLSSWLELAALAPTRVVSTTTVPLFQRVAAGLFLDVLYYQLNIVMLNRADAPVINSADQLSPHPANAGLGTDTHALKAS